MRLLTFTDPILHHRSQQKQKANNMSKFKYAINQTLFHAGLNYFTEQLIAYTRVHWSYNLLIAYHHLLIPANPSRLKDICQE